MKRLAIIIVLFSCLALRAESATLIVYGDSALPVEIHAAGELQKDIEHACGEKPEIKNNRDSVAAGLSSFDQVIYIGIGFAHEGIKKIAYEKNIRITEDDPGPEAFLLQSFMNYPAKGKTTLLIAGSDVRGTLYGAYEFSRRFLGIDPYEFWTGKNPPKCEKFVIPEVSFREKPPVFKFRGYFDNDDDMLANWKDPKLIVEFETWKEMIDSLARLRYNYIDLHDTLGRPEFWVWPYYTKKFDYHTDVALVDKIIDYAHSKGMMVQIPMGLGWEFHHLPYEKICLSKYYDDWMEVFTYYLEETPIGKADMFQARPRDPWWDHAYKCPEEEAAGIPSGPLTTKLLNGLYDLIRKYRPEGEVVSDLWAEGLGLWQRGEFNPNEDVSLLWADNGYAQYGEWPKDLKNHKFGIYIHAGYYLNHVVQDPYPDRIKEATMQAVSRGMTWNYFVNGQDFKHFILNLEACARAAWNPEGFDPEAFYIEWTTRYFGAEAAPDVVASLKALHRASAAAGGFTKVMDTTVELINKLRYINTEKVDTQRINDALAAAKESLGLAEKAAALVPPDARLVYDDQILFPAEIYYENLKLLLVTAETMNALADRRDDKLDAEKRKEAKERLATWKKRLPPQLKKLRDMLSEGSEWKKWEGWTKPENFRAITPPPELEDVERIVRTLQ